MARTIDTGTEDLLAHVDGNLGVITFNRPERRNALSAGIYDGFAAALPAMAADNDVRVVMITGNGGAFCAGGDVKGMNESHKGGGDRPGEAPSIEGKIADLRMRQRSVSLAIHQYPKPVVAALPGAAAGAGFSIALAADLRIGAERSIMVPAFVDVGGSGDFGGSWFLTQVVGVAKAKELYFRSPRISSAEALELGLLNAVLPDDEFADAAANWCQDIAAKPPIALRYIKENLNRAVTSDLATALDAEAPAMVRSMSTADHREAVAAFVEKRSATFSGE